MTYLNRKERNIKVLTTFLLLLTIIFSLVFLSNTTSFANINDSNRNQDLVIHPDLVIPTKDSILSGGYPTNENGQTYGPNMGNLMPEPDLILAEGANGVLGYIYPPQGISSPDELDEYNKSLKKSTPLYLHDGKTVIGTFYFGNSQYLYE